LYTVEVDQDSNLLIEARQRVTLLTQSLPLVADPASVSHVAKTPWKALLFRETLIWRTEELARIACDLYAADQLAAALTLTRACVEGVGACWYLNEVLQKVASRRDVADLDEKIMRLLMGSKNGVTELPAVNVLTFIDAVNKRVPTFKNAYEALCEYAHPNWSGTALLFSKNDPAKVLTELGRNPRQYGGARQMGLCSLVGALIAFEYSYNAVAEILPDVIALCEAAIKSREN
jgi:hypothetical protein